MEKNMENEMDTGIILPFRRLLHSAIVTWNLKKDPLWNVALVKGADIGFHVTFGKSRYEP